MRKTTKYKILMWMDALLIIMWPIALFTAPTTYPVWAAFLIGAVWCSDIVEFFTHWKCLLEAKIEEM